MKFVFLKDHEGKRHLWHPVPKWEEEAVGTALYQVIVLLRLLRDEMDHPVIDCGVRKLLDVAAVLGGPGMMKKVDEIAEDEYCLLKKAEEGGGTDS